MVVAVRTPPYNSRKDPAERGISILNIGLQSVGLVREKLTNDDLEKILKQFSGLKSIRALAEIDPELKEQVHQSVTPLKNLLKDVFLTSFTKRLDLRSVQSSISG